MFHEHAIEPFDGTKNSPMNHDRLVSLAIRADILEPETLRHHEIKLDRPALPIPSDGISNLKINFRTVESATAFIYLIVNLAVFESGFKAADRLIPNVVRSHGLFRAGRETDGHLSKIKGLVHLENELNDA